MNSQNMSIISLVLHASWVVQLVMLLLGVSVLAGPPSSVLFALKRVKTLNEDFERVLVGTSLNDLYARRPKRQAGRPHERILPAVCGVQFAQTASPTPAIAGRRTPPCASFQRWMWSSPSSFWPRSAGIAVLGLFGTVGHHARLTGFGMERHAHRARHCRALVATAIGRFRHRP